MEKVLVVVGALALVAGIALLFAWPTVWIMNYLFTDHLLVYVFGVAKITFWRAFFLDMLFAGWFKSTASTKS